MVERTFFYKHVAPLGLTLGLLRKTRIALSHSFRAMILI